MQEVIKFISIHPMLSLLWILLLSVIIFTTLQNFFSKISKINRYEAINLINKKNAIVVDLRKREDYLKGHIANSLNVVADNIKSGHIKGLDKTKNQSVIVVCANGNNSHHFAHDLFKSGFTQVYILKEGIYGWNSENLPLIQGK